MKQQRNTEQRQLILEAVKMRGDHPTANAIYLDVRAKNDRISRTTVYRNLGLLAQNGTILHISLPNVDRYDRRAELHDHLICTVCGSVCDAPLPYQPALDAETAAMTGYAVYRHRTIYEGICRRCQQIASVSKGQDNC